MIIDPQTKAVTHIVVEKGWLFSTNKVISSGKLDPESEDTLIVIHGGLFAERKLLPVLWISRIEEKEVYLSVSAALVERLPVYKTETG